MTSLIWRQEEGNKENPTAQGSAIQPSSSGPITRARAKKLRDSLQALVRDIQAQVGDTHSIQRLYHEDTILYTLIQVMDANENGDHSIRSESGKLWCLV